jgi:hypothetical protein
MTIDQQLRDRFDRATDRPLPQVDLGAAIADGRRIRRRRAASYTAGSLVAVTVAAGALLASLPGSDPSADQLASADGPGPDSSFVSGTDIDERLAASVAADLSDLPAPADVYPLDWRRTGNETGYAAPAAALRLPDDQFGDATAWQLRYDIEAGHTALITIASAVDGELPGYACDADGLLSVGPLAGMGRVPSCAFQHGLDDPRTSPFLTQSGGPSEEDQVFVTLTERVEQGTEAEAKARALFPEGTFASRLAGGLAAVLRTP